MSEAGRKREPTGVRLLELATDHIRRHGLERTTLVSVAREAQVSHAAIYRYYASKDDLIDAVTDAWLKRVETQLAGVADSPDPADDKLERMLLLVARLYRERLDGPATRLDPARLQGHLHPQPGPDERPLLVRRFHHQVQ